MDGTLAAADVSRRDWDPLVRAWLLGVALLVLAMIVVGGATRLTDSGLSITEWQPILGAVPPLSEEDWREAFAKYRTIPEYHHVNRGMSLEDFKAIFWWEWAHRFLGRFIGLAFALPLAFFWYVGGLRPGLGRKLAGILALGALQGGIGWFMVVSGLTGDEVDVSPYRLALHLGVAFLILAALIWTALDLGRPAEQTAAADPDESRLAPLLAGIVFLQVLLGAFVAGLKAGLAYNTWPTMDGAIVPEGLFLLAPWWINFFENPTLVQFNHRLVAYAIVAIAVVLAMTAWRSEGSGRSTRSAMAVLAAILAQVAIGIATLVLAVPLWLGVLHQGVAAVVFGLVIRHWHIVRSARRG